MTGIANLSDAPKYTIKTVATQTGIREVTLRAWERRYNVLRPRRSKGNYRLYSERDVALLRWLKSRVDSGVAVSSAAAELLERRRAGRWPQLAAPTPVPPESTTPGISPQPFAERLYAALTTHDEAAANAIMNEVLAAFDLADICEEIFAPCLVEIGEAWARGQIRVSTEHFASTYLRGRLLALLQTYPAARNAPHVVLGCAEGEHHEIGSLMLTLLLRRAGYRAEFLGADVPTEDLLAYARDVHPAFIGISAGAEEPARELARLHPGLAHLRPRPRLGYGGLIFNLQPELRRTTPGTYLGETAEAACQAIQAMLPLK